MSWRLGGRHPITREQQAHVDRWPTESAYNSNPPAIHPTPSYYEMRAIWTAYFRVITERDTSAHVGIRTAASPQWVTVWCQKGRYSCAVCEERGRETFFVKQWDYIPQWPIPARTGQLEAYRGPEQLTRQRHTYETRHIHHDGRQQQRHEGRMPPKTILDVQQVHVHHLTEVHHTYGTKHKHHDRPQEIDAQDKSAPAIAVRLSPAKEYFMRAMLGKAYQPQQLQGQSNVQMLSGPKGNAVVKR